MTRRYAPLARATTGNSTRTVDRTEGCIFGARSCLALAPLARLGRPLMAASRRGVGVPLCRVVRERQGFPAGGVAVGANRAAGLHELLRVGQVHPEAGVQS